MIFRTARSADRAAAARRVPRARSAARIRRGAAGRRSRPPPATPGSARMRCSAVSKNATRCAGVSVPRLRQRHAHRQHVARIEAGVDVAQRQQAAEHDARRPSAARATARLRRRSAAGACRTPTAPSLRPPSLSASFRSARPARSAGSAPARMPVRIDAPSDEQQHARVDRDLFGARQLAGQQRRAGVEAHAARAAGRAAPPAAASTQRLDQQLLEHAARVPAPSADANRDLLAPGQRAREQQVADVGAGDQQDQRRPRRAA